MPGTFEYKGQCYRYNELDLLSTEDRSTVQAMLLTSANKSMAHFRRYPRFFCGETGKVLVELLLHARPRESATTTEELRRMRDLCTANVERKLQLERQLESLLLSFESTSMEGIDYIIAHCLELEEEISKIKYGDVRDLKIFEHMVDTLPLVPMGFPTLPSELMISILELAQTGGNPRHYASVSRYFRQVYRENPNLLETWMCRDRWIRPVPVRSAKMVGLGDIVYTNLLKDGRYMLINSENNVLLGLPGIYFKSIGKVPLYEHVARKNDVLYMSSGTELFRFSEAMGTQSLFRCGFEEIVNLVIAIQNKVYFTIQDENNVGKLFRLDDDDRTHVVNTKQPFRSLSAVSESMFVFNAKRQYMIYTTLDDFEREPIATIDLDAYNPGFNFTAAAATNTTVLITLCKDDDPGEIILKYDAIKDTCTLLSLMEHTQTFGTNQKDTIVASRYNSYVVWDDKTHTFSPSVVWPDDECYHVCIDTDRQFSMLSKTDPTERQHF